MKKLTIFLGMLIFCGLTGAAHADIYSWVDADGIRHFSNHVPPKALEAVEITVEKPYVPPSTEELLEAQKAEILAEAERKIGELEAESLERLRSAQREIEAAKQEAAQALEQAEELRKAAEEKSRSIHKTVVYYGYFPYPRHLPYYKKERLHPLPHDRKDPSKKQFDGRKPNPGRRPLETRMAGRQNPNRPNSVHRPGGFQTGVGMNPGLLLRVR